MCRLRRAFWKMIPSDRRARWLIFAIFFLYVYIFSPPPSRLVFRSAVYCRRPRRQYIYIFIVPPRAVLFFLHPRKIMSIKRYRRRRVHTGGVVRVGVAIKNILKSRRCRRRRQSGARVIFFGASARAAPGDAGAARYSYRLARFPRGLSRPADKHPRNAPGFPLRNPTPRTSVSVL